MSATALPDQLSDVARAFASEPKQLLIGGEKVDATDGATFETLDPATGNVITTVAQGGPADVDRAVPAARRRRRDDRPPAFLRRLVHEDRGRHAAGVDPADVPLKAPRADRRRRPD